VLVELEVYDAGLDGRAAICDIEGDDPLETMEPDDDDVIGERSAR
jgi:hypothetical protein